MDNTPPPFPPPEPDVSAEFRKLGDNLRAIVQNAWQSEERQKLQEEIQKGLLTLTNPVRDFSEGETGQRVKTEVHELREKVHLDAVESQVRSGILGALRTLNTELEKATQKAPEAKTTAAPPAEATPTPETQPAPDTAAPAEPPVSE